jgi:hypothetical protein
VRQVKHYREKLADLALILQLTSSLLHPAILTQNLHWELLRSREAAVKELKSENVTTKALKRDHGMVEL